MAELARASMDFFAAQAAAKRRTGVLVVLFALAWALTIVLADLGITAALSLGDDRGGRHRSYATDALAERGAVVDRYVGLLLPVAAAVSVIVLLGTGWHLLRLGGDGGDAVARMLGGIPVDRGSHDLGEQRAVNVLEEMAIAAALPVPRLYVLEDPTINAFAAGATPERAVVAVTRGALAALSRDELQGVFAHELSHVLNHDSRLNLRLVSLVGGLTALALVGRLMLELAGRSRPRSSRDRDNSTLVFLLIGLALLVAGAIGAFFGRLIRLAVSREREFLADAAAVQFTRNPVGLAGALTKIAERGSALSSPHAPEAAHFFFASGLRGFTAGLLSTHPPIEERLRRLQAGPLSALAAPATAAMPPRAAAPARPRAAYPAMPAIPIPAMPGALAASPLAAHVAAAAPAAVGRLAPEHLARATATLAAFPAALVDASRTPAGARALVLALVLDADDPTLRERQLAGVEDAALAREAARLGPLLAPIAATERLGLLDLALPSLDALSPEQARALVQSLSRLAAADGRISLHEWALQRIVKRRLGPKLGAPRPAMRARALEQVEPEALELLSALAWVGQRDPVAAQRALEAGVRSLSVKTAWRLLPRDRVDSSRLDATLARLDETAPPLKAQLLAAATACVLADGRVTAGEADLLRAVAGSLGLPMAGLPAAASAA